MGLGVFPSEAARFILSALLLAAPLAAQDPPKKEAIPLTVQTGVPMRVVLDKRVPIKRVGTPIKAHLAEPVFVFDRMVLPAGTEVDGRMTRIEPLPRKARALAMLNGNFTPLRKAEVTFDMLVMKDGRRLPLKTSVSQGIPRVVHLQTVESGKGSGKKGAVKSKVGEAVAEARARAQAQRDQVVQEVKAPGKIQRVKSALAAQSPYRPQAFPQGASFIAELKNPLELGTEDYPSEAFKTVGTPVPQGSLVHATLETGLSSAKDQVGSPVRAVIAQPVFSGDHHLILPQGTSLEGIVTQVHPARRFGRNGELRFTFRQIELPSKVKQAVEASLEGVAVDSSSNLKLDAEGGAHAVTSKTHYIAPALEVLLATSSLDGLDRHHRDIQDTTTNGGADVGGSAVRGGAGFGFVGSIIALIARSRPVSAGFAFYGAAWSVYSHVVERGHDVVFAKDTAIEIRFGTHGPPGAPQKEPLSPGPTKFVSSSR